MSEHKFGDPSGLGLSAFALTTFCLMVGNTGYYELNTMILGLALAYGGSLQIVAGIIDYKNGNAFGGLAFASYGGFWISFFLMNVLPDMGIGTAPPAEAVGIYMLAWGVFTAMMFIGTLRMSRILQVVFGLLAIAFILLAIEHFLTGDISETIGKVTAYIGIVLGLSALYAGVGGTLNGVYGEEIFPMGKVE